MAFRKSIHPVLLALLVTVVFTMGTALSTTARAGTCGILPFSAGSGVGRGAADNIGSLVSTEVDIRGGFELVLGIDPEKVKSGCSTNSSCLQSLGRSEGFDKIVTGSVSARGSKEYIIRAELHDVGSGRLLRSVSRTLDRSPDSLLDEIPGMAEELLTGERPIQEDEGGQRESRNDLFVEDDINFGDDDDEPSSRTPSRAARDRQGRAIRQDDEEDDPLGLGDIEDMELDLDQLSAGTQSRKRKEREQREALEAERRAEQEQLAALAAEEERKRQEERRRRAADRQAEEDRRQRVAEERRREEERERAERERLERIRAEEEYERREEERRLADEARRRRELDEARREEQRRRDQRSARSNRYDEPQDNDVGFVIEDAEEDVGFVIEDAESEDDGYSGSNDRYSSARNANRNLGTYDDDYDDSGRAYSRGRSATSENSRRARSSRYDDDDPSTVRARPMNRDRNARDDRYYDDRDLDERDRSTVRARPTKRSRDERDYDEENLDDLEPDYDERRSGYGASSSASSSTSRRSLSRPSLAIRLTGGYTNYYLHFGELGLEVGIYVLPVLSVDVGFDIWMLSLQVEDVVNGTEACQGADGVQTTCTREGRGLPNFRVGASYRAMTNMKWFRPYGGAEFGAVMYAQKVQEGGTGARTPLFGMTIVGKGGVDFEFGKKLNFGVSLGAKVGVGLTGDAEGNGVPDIQEYVNQDWSQTRVIISGGATFFIRL